MAVDRNEVLKNYPQLAWALDIPDVAKVLEDAIAQKWDAGRLQAELEGTGWWQNTRPSDREYQEKLKRDKTSLSESLEQASAKLWDLNRTFGANLPASEINEIATYALRFGWNDKQMEDTIVQHARSRGPQGPEGNLGAISSSIAGLKQTASAYQVTLDDKTAYQWATEIAAGERKLQDFDVQFQTWAKSKYSYSPEIGRAIDSGQTVEQFFAPYKQEMAKYLETTPDSIDLSSPQWQQITDYADPNTGQRRVMSIYEAGRAVRNTEHWKNNTRNGQQVMTNLADKMLKTLGKTA